LLSLPTEKAVQFTQHSFFLQETLVKSKHSQRGDKVLSVQLS